MVPDGTTVPKRDRDWTMIGGFVAIAALMLLLLLPLQAQVGDLAVQVGRLDERLSNVEADVLKLQQDVSQLRVDVSQLQLDVRWLRDRALGEMAQ